MYALAVIIAMLSTLLLRIDCFMDGNTRIKKTEEIETFQTDVLDRKQFRCVSTQKVSFYKC